MKRIKRLYTLAVLPATLTMSLCSSAFALELTGIDMRPANGASEIRLNFDANTPQPRGFMLKNPPRLVLDIPNASMGRAIPKHQRGSGLVSELNVVEASRRVRLTFRLNADSNYTTKRQGNQLIVRVNGSGGGQYAPTPQVMNQLPEVPLARVAQPRRHTPAYAPKINNRKIDMSAKQKQWVDNAVKDRAMGRDEMQAALNLVGGAQQPTPRYQPAPRPRYQPAPAARASA